MPSQKRTSNRLSGINKDWFWMNLWVFVLLLSGCGSKPTTPGYADCMGGKCDLAGDACVLHQELGIPCTQTCSLVQPGETDPTCYDGVQFTCVCQAETLKWFRSPCGSKACDALNQPSENPDPSDSSYQAIGLSGMQVQVRAGRLFIPENCPDCMSVQGGRIRNPDGSTFVALGNNMPLLRVGYMHDTSWEQLKERNVKVVRMFASGNNLPDEGTQDQWIHNLWERTEAAYGSGIRVIIVLGDYYRGLPGETCIGDNYKSAQENYCGIPVRPWPWYRPGVLRFNFQSACPNSQELFDLPNFEVHYKPFALKVVERLKDHPGVFAWALGNEIRALGRGGSGAYSISQAAAVEHLASFFEDMIASIRAMDRNHLIIPGALNLSEVADENVFLWRPNADPTELSNQYLGTQWKSAFDRLLEVPFNVWTFSMYNENYHCIQDIVQFHAYAIPVIASEFEWGSGIDDNLLIQKTCRYMEMGLSLVAPWDMRISGSAWGKLGNDYFTNANAHCGDHATTPLPHP